MILQIVLAVVTLTVLFILFLVLSKTTGTIDNALYKLEYLLRKECDIKLEALEVKYKIKAADKKFDEIYNTKHIVEDLQKAVVGSDDKGDGGAQDG